MKWEFLVRGVAMIVQSSGDDSIERMVSVQICVVAWNGVLSQLTDGRANYAAIDVGSNDWSWF
jgi:hypothetical protein